MTVVGGGLMKQGQAQSLLGECSVFDPQALSQFAGAHAGAYAAAEPFPHIVIDDFISSDMVRFLLERFPDLQVRTGQESVSASLDGRPAQAMKRWISREGAVDLAFRSLYWELNCGSFLAFLERLTGIGPLLPDPYLHGAGLHEIRRGGFLRVHADFNRHRETRLFRRLNLLIYLNPDWDADWGGELELWSSDMSRCVERIAPMAGRCVIFSTSHESFHGHPHPLQCPEQLARRSLAMYYYTLQPGATDFSHDTLWQLLPHERG